VRHEVNSQIMNMWWNII